MRLQSSIFPAFALVGVPGASGCRRSRRRQRNRPSSRPRSRAATRPTPRCGSRCPRWSTPGATAGAPPSDAVILFDGNNLDQWVSTKDKSPARWKVADGVLTVDKSAGNIETKRSFTNYQLHIEWRIPADITGDGSGARQQRPVPRVHRAGRRRLRAADSRFVQQQDLRQRSGRQHLQAVHPARERQPQAGRMADLRRDLDRADLQRRRIAEDAGLRHRLSQRRAGAEPRRAEGRDASTSASPNTRSTGPARRSSCRRTAIPARPSASAISGCESSRRLCCRAVGLWL